MGIILHLGTVGVMYCCAVLQSAAAERLCVPRREPAQHGRENGNTKEMGEVRAVRVFADLFWIVGMAAVT